MIQKSDIDKPHANASKFTTVAPLLLLGDLDLQSTERLLASAQDSLSRRDHKVAAQLLERALPSIDRFYGEDAAARLRALRMLRDCYLALSKGIEAQDCAEVALSIFEEIMDMKAIEKSTIAVGTPSAFTRPVVRKLRTLRRARESEYLKRRSLDVSERWTAFTKQP